MMIVNPNYTGVEIYTVCFSPCDVGVLIDNFTLMHHMAILRINIAVPISKILRVNASLYLVASSLS